MIELVIKSKIKTSLLTAAIWIVYIISALFAMLDNIEYNGETIYESQWWSTYPFYFLTALIFGTLIYEITKTFKKAKKAANNDRLS